MTTAMQLFTNEEFGDVRVVMLNGEPWFIAADVCRVLELSNVSQALSRLDEDEKGIISTDTPGGEQSLLTVNEAGLYALVLSSRKPEAKNFKRWLTHEVIPTIRKTGGYSIQQTYTPATDAFKDAKTLADEIRSVNPNVQFGIALSKAVDVAEKAHNVSLQAMKELLPPAEHETGYLNATQIGERLGGIPPRTVNKMLAGKGMEYKIDGMWRLTEDGKEYGEEIPYTRNGHSGYQIRWSERVMELFGNEGATA